MGRRHAVNYEPPRYPKAPWLYDVADVRRQADGQLRICQVADVERLDGWRIVRPRDAGDEMLMVRAERGNGHDGGHIKLSIAPWPQTPPPAMDMRLMRSNPRRYNERTHDTGDD